MKTQLHPAVAQVTQRIVERSRARRAAYLARIDAACGSGPHRKRLSCGNLAHGFAACSTGDKQALRSGAAPNLGIVTSFNDMEQLHRHLVWKIVGAAFGSVLLLLIGGGWLLWQYRADIDRQRISAELLRAYNQADVTLCEERLCANVDDKAAAYGERKQYRPVRPR